MALCPVCVKLLMVARVRARGSGLSKPGLGPEQDWTCCGSHMRAGYEIDECPITNMKLMKVLTVPVIKRVGFWNVAKFENTFVLFREW